MGEWPWQEQRHSRECWRFWGLWQYSSSNSHPKKKLYLHMFDIIDTGTSVIKENWSSAHFCRISPREKKDFCFVFLKSGNFDFNSPYKISLFLGKICTKWTCFFLWLCVLNNSALLFECNRCFWWNSYFIFNNINGKYFVLHFKYNINSEFVDTKVVVICYMFQKMHLEIFRNSGAKISSFHKVTLMYFC